jgi:hypothetical protein
LLARSFDRGNIHIPVVWQIHASLNVVLHD